MEGKKKITRRDEKIEIPIQITFICLFILSEISFVFSQKFVFKNFFFLFHKTDSKIFVFVCFFKALKPLNYK